MRFTEYEKLLISLAAESIKPSERFKKFTFDRDKWDETYKTASSIKVNSQLLGWLEKLNLKKQVPEDTHKALLSSRIHANYRNAILIRNYETIFKKFSQADIKMQAIKGLWILNNRSLKCFDRITSDIDILVSKDRLSQAAEILSTMGYKQDPVKSRRTKNQPTPNGHHLVPFRKSEISVELHYSVYPGSPRELNDNILDQATISQHYNIFLHHFLRHTNRGDFNLKWLYDLLFLTNHLTKEQLTEQILESESKGISPQAMQLMRLLADWKLKKNPQYQILLIINLLEDCSFFEETNPKPFLSINLLETLFPTTEYLRFIYPKLCSVPAFILYPIRWTILFKKGLLLVYRNVIVFQGFRHVLFHSRNSSLVKRMGT